MEETQIERIIALMDLDGKFDDAQGTDATVALWNRLNRISRTRLRLAQCYYTDDTLPYVEQVKKELNNA